MKLFVLLIDLYSQKQEILHPDTPKTHYKATDYPIVYWHRSAPNDDEMTK